MVRLSSRCEIVPMVGPSLSPKASTRIASAVFAASTLLILPLFLGVACDLLRCMYVCQYESPFQGSSTSDLSNEGGMVYEPILGSVCL